MLQNWYPERVHRKHSTSGFVPGAVSFQADLTTFFGMLDRAQQAQ
jgi:hypothetical protein